MPIIGTFGSFTAARMGIYASQASLNVTGNNIANINTDGYTRQRMDLVALHSWGTGRYANKMSQDIGYGVLTNGVSQLRDPFLDIRYREEQANVGAAETWLDCLNQLSHTLDEVGQGDDFGIWEKQFNDFAYQIQQLNGNVGTTEYDTTARSSAEVLCNLFRSYATALEKVQSTQLKNIKDDVTSVNTILTQIRSLNEEIRESGIYGAKALELRDERNVLIDELATYMKIDVSYDMEKLDEFNSVERLNINIANSGTPPIRLICGTYGAQIGMPERAPMRNPAYNFDDPNDPNNFIEEEREVKDENGDPVLDDDGNPKKETVKVSIGKYVAEGGYDPDTGAITKYTDNPVTKEEAEAKWLETHETVDGLKEPEEGWAYAVDNAKEDNPDENFNRLWMNVQPLVDKKNRVFRDSDGNKSEMVELDENLLYGSLQSKREFLLGEGEFSSERELMYDKDATTTRGVPYYRQSLDALAQKFAKMFNEANQFDMDMVTKAYLVDDSGAQKVFIGKDGATVKDSTGKDIDPDEFNNLAATLEKLEQLKTQLTENAKDSKLTAAQKEENRKKIQQEIDDLEAEDGGIEARAKAAYQKLEILRQEGQLNSEYAYYNGGVLFSSSGDENNPEGITAKNITIAKGWSTGEVRILNTKKPDTPVLDENGEPVLNEDGSVKMITHSTRDDNTAHMINLISAKLDYLPKESVADAAGTNRYFNGSFQERFADMNVMLAVDKETTTTLYDSYSIKSLSLENERQSVSGVDLNDEALNMMVFQKSYAAACQLMTTLDSMLDKLINGTLR